MDERGGEELEGKPEREQGPERTYDFHIHSVANGTCRVLSKGMNCLVCCNRIAIPAELRVIQIGSRNDSRKVSQNDSNPSQSSGWLRLGVVAVEEVRSSQI